MKEWSKLDLHVHTQPGLVYNNENDGTNTGVYYNLKNLVKRNEINNLDLISITNHNIINTKELLRAAYASKYSKTNVLPGVELDVKIVSQVRYHIIVVFSETTDIVAVQYKLSKFLNENGENCLSLQNLFELISNTEAIIIPHGCKNPHGFKPTQLDDININDAINLVNIITSSSSVNVLFEHTKPHFNESFKSNLINLAKEKWLSVDEIDELQRRAGAEYVGSDYRFSNQNIEKETRLLSKIWASPTFRGLQISCIFPLERIKCENAIFNKVNYIKQIIIGDSDNFYKSNITFSSGLNSIIGESASGKTALLDIITTNLIGKKVVEDKDYTDLCKNMDVKFYNQDGYPLRLNDINIIIAKNLYDSIRKAHDTGDNAEILKLFNFEADNKSYVLNLYEKSLNLAIGYIEEIFDNEKLIKSSLTDIKERNNILLLNNMSNSEQYIIKIPTFKEIQKMKKYTETNNLIIQYKNELFSLNKIQNELRYKLDDLEIENNLDKLLELLEKEINSIDKRITFNLKCIKRREIIFNKLVDIVYRANNKINQKSAFISNTKNKLVEKKETLIESIKRYKLASYRLDTLDLKFPQEKIITELNKKNQNNYIEVEYPDLKNILKLDDDSGLIGLRGNTKLLKDYRGKIVADDFSIKNIFKLLLADNKIPELRITKIIKDIVVNSVIKIGFPGQTKINVSDLTPGLTAKMYIDYLFNEEIMDGVNNVVVFDQPENDVDKAFIYSELIPKISNAKFNIQVIITSHEPLLVINGDSNRIIKTERINNKIMYTSYNLDEYLDKETVTNVISKYVDGHINAVKDRYEIYIGGRNEYKINL